MIRLIFGGYCLALCAMFIGAAVQAEQPDPVAPADMASNVPLPTPGHIEITRANMESYKQAMINGILYGIMSSPIDSDDDDDTIIDEIVYPTPQEYVDYDNDGFLDLVRIEVDGKAYVYINSGTNENPIYTKGIIYEGDQSIVDKLKDCKEKQKQTKPQRTTTAASTEAWVELNYNRFEVFIEQEYYNSNQADLDNYFTHTFGPRFDLLEELTQWDSETSHNQKLKIEISTIHPDCPGAVFKYALTEGFEHYIELRLPSPLYPDNPPNPYICKRPYWENESPHFNNPGELGDYWWYYGSLLIHESTHAINPNPIIKRSWLTEGFARYHEYNILSNYEGIPGITDINQETANHDIHVGDNFYNWECYSDGFRDPEDYKDCSITPKPIQESLGYDITAWMFSMLRDPTLSEDWSFDPIDWNAFYTKMSTNYELLNKAYELGQEGPNSRYTDMVIIDLFGRAVDMSFDEIKAVFRYDGPDGPGWGVREWVSRDWYADLTPSLSFSVDYPIPGETIDLIATVYNNGDTDANDFSVRFYEGEMLLDEQFVSVSASSSLMVTTPYTGSEGIHTLSVYIDEDNIKLETDETNNDDTQSVTFETCCVDRVGNANGMGGDEPTIGDVSTMIDALFISGDPNVIACFAEADINQSGGLHPASGDVTIGDVSTLIDYLFITGPTLGLPECL